MNLLIKFSFLALLIAGISGSTAFSQNHAKNTRNTHRVDSLYQPIQISFLPWLSTSGSLSGKTNCKISLNIIAGITGSVTGFQTGSVVNIVRKNSGKAQIGGIGNITGNTSSGIQCAGVFNISKELKGVQISGVVNYVHDTAGLQLSGLLNQSSVTRICQLSGLINNTGKTKVQVAGLANICAESPVQIAGVFNKTSGYSRLQISGLVNIADNVGGLQAGIINMSKTVNGVQIGIVNIADSCEGVPLGLINIIRNGYHVLEISADEMYYADISFRSGTKKFHSIITAGIRPDNLGSPLWTYGSGFGSLLRLSEKNKLGIDFQFLNIVKNNNVGDNYLYRVGIGIDHVIAPKTSIYLGFTGNWLSVDRNQRRYNEYYENIAPYYLFGSDTHRRNNKVWLGAKLGLRLF